MTHSLTVNHKLNTSTQGKQK